MGINQKVFGKSSTILCKDVKLTYQEVCPVSRRYLCRYGLYLRKTEVLGFRRFSYPRRRCRVNPRPSGLQVTFALQSQAWSEGAK